ncbi:MAG: tRNA(Ile)-lysidine synthetase-like protein, partial [Candidatus Marinamargulisbacteria bacterium]
MTFEKMVRAVQSQKLFGKDDQLLIAFSGGPDSVFLVLLLLQLISSSQIVLVYLDHGLRSESACESKFIHAFGKRLGLRTISRKIPVGLYAEKRQVSLETAGRHLRHGVLRHLKALKGATCVVTAHHADDFDETIMHRLIRGGLGKLGQSEKESCQLGCRFIKPLSVLRKRDMLDYLESEGVSFCEDNTNHETVFTRNKIRNNILPSIKAINPNFSKSLHQIGTYMTDVNAFLDATVAADFSEVKRTECAVSFPLSILQNRHPVLQGKIVVKMLNCLYKPTTPSDRWGQRVSEFSYLHVSAILDQLKIKSNRERVLSLPGRRQARFSQGQLTIGDPPVPISTDPFVYSVSSIPGVCHVPELGCSFHFSVVKNEAISFGASSEVAYFRSSNDSIHRAE